MEVLAGLSVADARDVLEYAAELIERAKGPARQRANRAE